MMLWWGEGRKWNEELVGLILLEFPCPIGGDCGGGSWLCQGGLWWWLGAGVSALGEGVKKLREKSREKIKEKVWMCKECM